MVAVEVGVVLVASEGLLGVLVALRRVAALISITVRSAILECYVLVGAVLEAVLCLVGEDLVGVRALIV